MTKHEFRHSTMRDVNLRIKTYREEKEYKAKELEYQCWLTGIYVQNAIASCFSKKSKYPKNPLEEKKVVEEDMHLSEEKADFYREQFLKRLQRMEKRFNNSKKKETGADGR